MGTSPLLEKKRGRYAFLTTKGESSAFGKVRSRKTCPAAHVRATSGGAAEESGFALRQTPTQGQRGRCRFRQPSHRRLQPKNQGTQRTDDRINRMRTHRLAGFPHTHDTLRHIHQDHRSKNKRFARSKLPRAPCNRRRPAPSSPQICPSCGSQRGIILNFPFAVKTPQRLIEKTANAHGASARPSRSTARGGR